jgi:hypothetical protein
MTCQQLRKIIRCLEGEHLEYKQIVHWKTLMHTQKPGVILTLRYVGETEAPRSPYRRFLDDATRVSICSPLLLCFLSVL